MNVRTLILIGAVALLGVGLLMVIADFFQEPAPESSIVPAIAVREIQPYTVITQDMVQSGPPIRSRDASAQAIYPLVETIGKMTTAQLQPGDTINGFNAKPVETVRFVKDLGLELVSFTASTDRLLGGQLRSGQIVNLYGNGRDSENRNFTVLVEPRLWVVEVLAGAEPAANVTPQVNPETGEYEQEQDDARPGTMITVAVPPQVAFHIIDSLGAQGLEPWVTLAANQTAQTTLPTPVVTPAPTSTAGLPLDLALTATALWLQLQPTAPAGPPRTGDGGSQ
jgi:hypothetical protein